MLGSFTVKVMYFFLSFEKQKKRDIGLILFGALPQMIALAYSLIPIPINVIPYQNIVVCVYVVQCRIYSLLSFFFLVGFR